MAALWDWDTEKGRAAAERLARLVEMSMRVRPYEFLQACLADGGRSAFFAVLGREAEDVIEEMLSLALHYEREEPPTLQGFVSWLDRAAGIVKRDMEQAGEKTVS